MKELDKIERSIAKYRAATSKRLAILLQRRLDFVRSYLVECTKCHARNPLSTWAFIQELFYVAPYSCNGGDYYLRSEIRVCHIICPACGHENYLHNHPAREEIIRLIGKEHRYAASEEIFVRTDERSSG